MKFDKLYLRVTALLNAREVHYDYVISPNADDLTDEKADLMKQELNLCLKTFRLAPKSLALSSSRKRR